MEWRRRGDLLMPCLGHHYYTFNLVKGKERNTEYRNG